ncbi:Major facilitator superfamily domain, general substrate transporter [Beauveria brongniartii RCEF 3172]|uniref:Major facilitator superfamily domain, general substrate transporter n=1 Tax=Beauveria brongniartii RCEF 3172 TaxID=1081107 RepID=A0A166WAB8_9HYPO|nr:Major facilitator superfamily domain, general substrate transporter [Beauveria brongniartii RCEF 3172]
MTNSSRAIETRKDVEAIVTTGVDTDSANDQDERGIRFVPRGEAMPEASSSQESIAGYDAELMSGRTLLSAAEEKKLLRKIDWRLMTLCSLIFMFKQLDSQNISNARIMNRGTSHNIMKQLGMIADEYNLVTVAYYIPYIVGEAPSNLLLKYFSPSKWQSRIMIGWGIFLMCHVPVKNICGNTAGILGGLLAYGFDTISGAGGLSGWQWLFLVEGLATVLFGSIIWFVLPDFPETASWLTEREKKFIQARLPANAPRAAEANFNLSEIVASLRDKRLWLFTLIWATFTVGTQGVTFYQSTVIANLGFSTIAQAQLLNLPITVTALLIIAVTGIMADRRNIPRPLYPLTFLVIIVICYGVFVAHPSSAAIYAVTLIGNAVTAAWFPVMWPWRVQTTSHATGSAFSIGFVNSYGQIGGALGPQIFRSHYGPRYTVPFCVAMGLVGACIILTMVTWWITRSTESETRRIKQAKLAADRRGETVLEDVVDMDLKPRA